ncbi:MAG: hypothetical protein ACJ8FO_12135 [Sphingomicrobium sp.]
MADPSNDEKFDKGKEKQVIGGQQSHRSEYGRQGDQTDASSGQPIGGNDSGTGSGTPLTQGAKFGGQSATGQAQTGTGSAPPRSMGTRGTEFGQFGDSTGPAGQQGQSGTGQADLGSQAGSTLAGRSDQQELGEAGGEVDQPASYGGGIGGRQSNTEGEGFILQQGGGSDDLRQRESAASAKATDGTDFAREGRGADEDGGEGDPS